MANIGIIGYGKMGKEIFAQCLRQPEISNITVYCIEEYEPFVEKMKKELSKSLKRKKITEEQYNAKSENIRFTGEISDLSDCDIIIETIIEDLDTKKSVFAAVDAIAKPDCILASNTSSLSIPHIFDGISNKERCSGLHFFYPVQFSGFAEINALDETSDSTVEWLKAFLGEIGKKHIIFRGCYHIYLNQIINAAISCGIVIRRENKLTMAKARDIMSELFPMHSLFGMIDGIGLDLLAGNSMANSCTRIDHICDLGTAEMRNWLASGVSGKTGCFFDTLDDTEFPEREVSDDEAEEICLETVAFIINEAVTAANEYGGDPKALIEAAQDAVGLADTLASYYEKYGYDTIRNALEKMFERTGIRSFEPADKGLYDVCFK